MSPLHLPDERGHFGKYGGGFVPETLVSALNALEKAYHDLQREPAFQQELLSLLRDFVGRPTPLFLARQLTRKHGKGRIYLKREDLCHTGAHKINNTVGQILLAKHLHKTRISADTGAGKHR